MNRKTYLMAFVMIVAAALAACDSGSATKAPEASSTPAAAQSGSTATAQPALTPAAAQAGPTAATGDKAPTRSATAAPAATANNLVPTAAPGTANTSFQTARVLGKDPLKFGVKESELYYKIEIARGGIVSVTLTVEAGSPGPAKLTLFSELQEFVTDVAVPVGKSTALRYIFNGKGGGDVFLSVRGESNVTLSAQALAQNDGGSKGDAGDTFDKPTTVALGTFTGMLGDADTDDIFAIDLPKTGGIFNISVKTADGAIKVAAYDDKQNWINEASTDKNRPNAGSLPFVLATGQGGRWFVSLRGAGTYTVVTSFGAQNDAGSGKDAPGEFGQALLIKPGAYTGFVGGPDSDDIYAFDLGKAGGVLNVTIKTTDGPVKATVYDDNQGWIAEVKADKDHADGAAIRYIISVNKGGKWYLEVNGEGAYAFSVAFVVQNDGGSGKDAGDSTDTAVTPKSAEFTGTIGDADESDYYKIPATIGRKVNVKFVKGEGTLKVTLYDKGGGYIKDVEVASGQALDLSEDSGATTDYYLEIQGGSGDYAVKISK
ncbi:MAG: hypothetical protein HZB53_13640 [Chloroflexi bacterium]|nr:hypothetical protein [Chloroflexota bacterium]